MTTTVQPRTLQVKGYGTVSEPHRHLAHFPEGLRPAQDHVLRAFAKEHTGTADLAIGSWEHFAAITC